MNINKKLKDNIVVLTSEILILGATTLLALCFLKLFGTPDEWETHYYYYSKVDKSILTDSDVLVDEGDYKYFSTNQINKSNNYQEDILFLTYSENAIIGVDTVPYPYLFGMCKDMTVSFTVKDINIYKLEFSNIYVSQNQDDPSPVKLEKNEYQVSKTSSDSYQFKIDRSSNFYLYSFNITYLVHK